jgi:uncharacterized membrane protein YfcA
MIGDLTLLQALTVVLAGFAAGALNAVVGSGSLITFPTLVAVGVPPLSANVSNTIGLVPGAVASVYGYRHELSGLGGVVRRLVPATVAGAVVGVVLLLAFPESAFEAVVPVLVGLAVLLVLLQPWVARRARAGAAPPSGHAGWLWAAVGLTGVYGAYFGAAQGVLLIGVLGLGTSLRLQQVNAVKNVLAGGANLVAAIAFAVVAPVVWVAAGLVAIGSTLGGWLGARIARRLPVAVLRGVVVTVGLLALVLLLLD